MERRGFLLGTFFLAAGGTVAAKPAAETCPAKYKDSDWKFMRETYMVGATKVNAVIKSDATVPYSPLETVLPKQGTAKELKKLDEIYGEFAQQGKLSDQGNLWRDIRTSLHTAELAEINAKYDSCPPAKHGR